MGVKAAILGYGRSGSSMHARAIEKNEPFTMTAVCDIAEDRRNQAHERFGCPVYEDYHQMLAEEKLDLVSVITRSDQHCQMTCDCLEAGVNVLVTKPWAVNEAEARRMIAAAEASGKQLLPWLPSRWGCVYRRLKQLIEQKAIGNVFLVRRSVCSFKTRNDWQMDRRHGGGYLLNWGPHIVDPPILALGSPVKTVYARMRQTINPGDAEDLFLALMTLANGAIVQVEYTIACENLPEWFIQGDRGTIVVHGQDITVRKQTPVMPADPTQGYGTAASPGEVIEEHVDGALYGDEVAIYAEIADALQGGAPYAVSTQDALELTRVLDAIRASGEGNCVVDLG